MPASCFGNQHRSVNSSNGTSSASSSLHDHHQSTLTAPDEVALKQRFASEGIDPTISDVKKLPYVWQWLNDAECNCLSLRKQIEKLHRQQEIDLREVENYVNHVWQVSSDKIKSLETQCHSLNSQLNAHRANGCLLNRSLLASDFIDESFEKSGGIRSFFRRSKSKCNDKMSPSNQSTHTLPPLNTIVTNGKISEETIQQNDRADKCFNKNVEPIVTVFRESENNIQKCDCDTLIAANEPIVHKLQTTVRELQVENGNLTSKLSQLLRVCTLLRSKLREKYQQSREDAEIATGSRHVDSDTRDPRTSFADKSCQTDNSSINSFITSVEKNTLNSNDTGIFSNVSSTLDQVNHNNCSSVSNDTSDSMQVNAKRSEKDEIITQLTEYIRKLEKQMTSKDASYADLVKKYEMRKQVQSETVSRLREHIDRENRKWQQLFRAANVRKRQALAQLDHQRASALASSSSQMDIG